MNEKYVNHNAHELTCCQVHSSPCRQKLQFPISLCQPLTNRVALKELRVSSMYHVNTNLAGTGPDTNLTEMVNSSLSINLSLISLFPLHIIITIGTNSELSPCSGLQGV